MTTSIFVGNIPYSFTQDELKKKLSLVGPVKAFNIKYDGKNNSKGFGFCDYCNTEIALSALRNLNKIDYNGRQLRIGVPEVNKAEVLSEEHNLTQKDISFIKDENPQNNENQKSNNNKSNFQNLLLGLSEEQKILLLYTMRTLKYKEPGHFKKLLENQNNETLNAILAVQNDIISKFNSIDK